MKKLLAVLSALLLIACMSLAVAETARREDFLGNWNLQSLRLSGVELAAGTVGITGLTNFHEDDTVAFSLGDRFCVSPVTYANGSCTFKTPTMDVTVLMNADGKLVIDADLESGPVQMILARAPQTAPAEGLMPYLGSWRTVGVTLDGTDVSDLSGIEIQMSVYPDGYAMLEMNGENIGAMVNLADGKVTLKDDSGGVYPMSINAQGQLVAHINSIVLTMEMDKADAPAQSSSLVSAFGMLTQKTKEPVSLEGVWVCTRADVNGVEYSAEEKGMEITLTVKDGVDTLNFGGNLIEREAVVTEDSVTIGGIRFVLNDRNELVYTMSEDGVTIRVYLEKQGAAAQQKQAPAGLEGVWVCTRADVNGESFTAEEKGMEITLTVKDGVDTLNFGGNLIEREAVVTEDSVTIGGIRFVLNDRNELVYTMSEDGVTIRVYMERQGY